MSCNRYNDAAQYAVEALQHSLNNQTDWLAKRGAWTTRADSSRLQRFVEAALERNRAALARVQTAIQSAA